MVSRPASRAVSAARAARSARRTCSAAMPSFSAARRTSDSWRARRSSVSRRTARSPASAASALALASRAWFSRRPMSSFQVIATDTYQESCHSASSGKYRVLGFWYW